MIEGFLSTISTIKLSKSLLRLVVPLLLTLVLLCMLLRPLRWQDMLALQKRLDWKWLVTGALAYWAEVILVGLRAAILLSAYGVQPRITILLASNLHNFINKITPARIGEISFPLLLQKYAQISYKRTVPALVVARIADLCTICFLAPVILILSDNTQVWTYLNWPWLLIIVGLVSLSTILFTKRVYRLIDYIEQLLAVFKSQRLSAFLTHWRDLCSMVESIMRRKLFPVGICSVLIWFLLYFTFIALGEAMNTGVPTRCFLVSGTFAILGTMMPIGGIGHFGGLEAGWVLGLMLVGTTYANAITSAIGTSLLITFFALLIAIASLGVLEITPRCIRTLLTAKEQYGAPNNEECTNRTLF